MNDLLAAHRCTTNNWAQIGASRQCGCCNCMQVFPRDEIIAWTGLEMDNLNDPDAVNQQTALCPKCGGEAVIGDQSGFPINVQFLGRMNEAWYQRTIIHKPRPRK